MIITSKRAERRRNDRASKASDLPSRYVSLIKIKPCEIAWKLFKQNGTRYKRLT